MGHHFSPRVRTTRRAVNWIVLPIESTPARRGNFSQRRAMPKDPQSQPARPWCRICGGRGAVRDMDPYADSRDLVTCLVCGGRGRIDHERKPEPKQEDKP